MTEQKEVAMHVLAQLTRFVVRGQKTADQAAELAWQISDAFHKEENSRRWDVPDRGKRPPALPVSSTPGKP